MTLQQALGSPDNEWAVLAPKVQAVLEAETQLAAAGSINSRGGGRTAAGTPGIPTIQSTLTELYAVLQDSSQGDDVVKEKLEAYRVAVKAAEAALKTAREGLRSYVTLRQEAILMELGYLD